MEDTKGRLTKKTREQVISIECLWDFPSLSSMGLLHLIMINFWWWTLISSCLDDSKVWSLKNIGNFFLNRTIVLSKWWRTQITPGPAIWKDHTLAKLLFLIDLCIIKSSHNNLLRLATLWNFQPHFQPYKLSHHYGVISLMTTNVCTL